MKKFILSILSLAACLLGAVPAAYAQAPQGAGDVMLQAFYWDSYGNDTTYGTTTWSALSSQVSEISQYFDLVWLPPSASAEGSGGVGYHPRIWSSQSSSWGSATTLKSLIAAFKENGTRVVADIVINHRAGCSGWNDFCAENFGDYGSFNLNSSHICCDDECTAKGYSATGANDQGYETLSCDGVSASGAYCGTRDLDHSSSYVQEAIKAYLKYLKNEFGYDGWRYDLVKGYLGKYNKIYNDAAGAYFSVGEYWDGSYDNVKTWINATQRTSNAFDFPLKYAAFNNSLASNNYSGLVSGFATYQGLAGGADEKGYSVTFVDNHDTFRDTNKYGGNWSKAYAYILAGPGIPCVFWPHWYTMKDEIKQMIAARKACGITNTSEATTSYNTNGYYEGTTTGTTGTLKCFIGGSNSWSTPSGYTLACSGDGWAYYTTVVVPTGPTLTMSPASGYVGTGGKVTLTATGTNVTIYYTTNGATPSSSSTRYSSPITITTDGTTVKAIAIDGSGNSSSIVSGTFYTTQNSVSVAAIGSGNPISTTALNIYAWNDDGTLAGAWPGSAMTKNSDGNFVYELGNIVGTYNAIICSSDGKVQTVDVEGLSGSSCIKVASTKTGDNYDASAVDCTGILAVNEAAAVEMAIYYDADTRIATIDAAESLSKASVINTAGKTVIVTGENSISLSGLSSGLYFIKAEFENGASTVGKVIVR